MRKRFKMSLDRSKNGRKPTFRGDTFATNPSPNAAPPGAGLDEIADREDKSARHRRIHRATLSHEIRTGEPDPYRQVRRTLVDEPEMLDRLDAYIAAGGPPIPINGRVSSARRVLAVETALDEWEAGRSKTACASCGSFAFRWPGPFHSPNLDVNAKAPAHITRSVTLGEEKLTATLCGWCDDQARHLSDGLESLSEAVFGAMSGYQARANIRARLAFEVPDKGDGRPWSHLDNAAIVGIARAELRNGNWRRSALVRTPEQARELARRVGIAPDLVHVWTKVPERAAFPSFDPPTSPEREKRLNAEREAAAASQVAYDDRKADRAAALAALDNFKARHPLPADGSGWADEIADQWSALLSKHRTALNSDRGVGARR